MKKIIFFIIVAQMSSFEKLRCAFGYVPSA